MTDTSPKESICEHCKDGNPTVTHPIFGDYGWHSVKWEDGDFVQCTNIRVSLHDLFEIAVSNPCRLVNICNNPNTSLYTRIFAIGALGRAPNIDDVIDTIKQFLKSERAIYRESAIYAICDAEPFRSVKDIPAELIDHLREMIKTDPSNTIRDIANDALEELEAKS